MGFGVCVQHLVLPHRRITAPLQRLREIIFDWRPVGLAGICCLLLILAVQLPLTYSFYPGLERGMLSDGPFLREFYPFEGSRSEGYFRWSRQPGAQIDIPGLGSRPVALDMTIVSHRGQWDAAISTAVTLRPAAELAPMRFTLRQEAARYRVLIPARALPQGRLQLAIETDAWQPANDRRDRLGIALGEVLRISTLAAGIILPDRMLLAGYAIGILLFWLTLRIIGFGRNAAWWMLLPLALIIPAIALIEVPRLAFGGGWIIEAGLIALLIGAISTIGLPALLSRTATAAPDHIVRWLV